MCGKRMKTLVPHIPMHGISVMEYKDRFPKSQIQSEARVQAHKKSMQSYYSSLRRKSSATGIVGSSNTEANEANSFVDYKNIRCLVCDSVYAGIDAHVKSHGLTSAKYRELFPGAALRSEDWCDRISLNHTGHPVSPETRQVIREKTKELWSDDSYRSRLVDAHTGFVMSDEAKKKLSDGQKQRLKNDPAWRDRLVAAGRKHIKWRDTKPELDLASILDSFNVEYEKQYKLKGLSKKHRSHEWDFAIPKLKILLEADGCLWHLCPTCNILLGKKREKFYKQLKESVDRSVVRDAEAQNDRWIVLRFWEHELKDRPAEVAGAIARAVEGRRTIAVA